MPDPNFLEGVADTDTGKDAKPISDMDRVILNNLFDTQPERRSAYLKKLGYEMNPKDDNEYRPLGSATGYAEIDPGISAYFRKGGLAELGKDIGDVGFDTIVAGPLQAGGATAGSPLGIAGVVLGGGAGNAAAEGIKAFAGDLLLDESIPVDKQGMILQSVFTGMVPAVLKGGKKLAAEGLEAALRVRKDAIINAAKQSGGGLTEDILDRAVNNPEMFTREAVDGATGRLKNTYREIFGLDSPLKLDAPEKIKGGVFGKKMDELNAQANSEIQRLANEPAASFTLDELAGPIKVKILDLSQKFSRNEDEKAALKYLKQQLADLEQSASKQDNKIRFDQARDWLSDRQSEVMQKDTAGNYLNPYGRVLGPTLGGQVDQFGNPVGLRVLIDKKAESLGSSLPQINSKRSEVLGAYNVASEKLTPSNMMTAFIGNDTIAKEQIKDATLSMDKILGTQLSSTIENGQMQRVVENLYKNPKGFGSGRVNPELVRGGVGGAVKGAIGGAGTALATGNAPLAVPAAIAGGIGGAAIGAERAAMIASPERALEALQKNASQITRTENYIDQLAQQKTPSLPQQIAGGLIGREVAPQGMPEPTPTPQASLAEPNFLEGIDFDQ